MSANPWYLLRDDPCPAARNMAVDEALLETVAGLGRPVLRFYSWSGRPATFGYAQRFADVARWTLLRPLVRRPTGGGLVPHDADWTYSVAVPPGHSWHGLKAQASYERIHQWIGAAFLKLGIETTLASSPQKEIPGQCFVGAEKSDVLWHGRKIAGAAQRRTRAGLLIQGSVQPPPVFTDRGAWETAMVEAGREQWEILWEAPAPDEKFDRLVTALETGKYSQVSHNEKR